MEINEIADTVVGSAMKVHGVLGNGFPEEIYLNSMALELETTGISFERNVKMPLLYKEETIGEIKFDFLVEGYFMVEVKTVEKLLDIHKENALINLETFNNSDGLLINFGAPSLECKRLFNKRYISKSN